MDFHPPHLPPKAKKGPKPVAVNKDTLIPATRPVEIWFDGACAPNPGPMGIGYLLITGGQEKEDTGAARVLVRVGAQIGQGTNNEAEYQALISALRHALKLGALDVRVRTDSNLVYQQVRGRWGVKDKRLARLLAEAKALLMLTNSFTISHVYREQNTAADALSHEIVFEEPEMPPLPPPTKGGAERPRHLQSWQAALIRVWWLSGRTRNSGLLSRIFGVPSTTIEQIAEGKTYRDATFENLPAYAGTPESRCTCGPNPGDYPHCPVHGRESHPPESLPLCYCGQPATYRGVDPGVEIHGNETPVDLCPVCYQASVDDI